MSLPVLVREMLPEERALVLSDWKKDLNDARPGWGRALHAEEWWALVNYVVDRITLPSVTVWMGCHRSEPTVPLCWAASRDGHLLHMHARASVCEDAELAARLQRVLTDHAGATAIPYNPLLELKRP